MQASLDQQLKRLATSDTEEARTRYKALCDRRDAILTHAVTSGAKLLLEESGYRYKPDFSADQNNQQAVNIIEEHLAQSSISETDQDLLALVGTGALFGWTVGQAPEEASPPAYRFYRTDGEELDLVLVHRLAKALDRSYDHQPMLYGFVHSEAVKLSQQEAGLVTVAVQTLLSEAPVSELEEDLVKVILDSILGG